MRYGKTLACSMEFERIPQTGLASDFCQLSIYTDSRQFGLVREVRTWSCHLPFRNK